MAPPSGPISKQRDTSWARGILPAKWCSPLPLLLLSLLAVNVGLVNRCGMTRELFFGSLDDDDFFTSSSGSSSGGGSSRRRSFADRGFDVMDGGRPRRQRFGSTGEDDEEDDPQMPASCRGAFRQDPKLLSSSSSPTSSPSSPSNSSPPSDSSVSANTSFPLSTAAPSLPRFIMYRIFGNELPPMHAPGELVSSLRYMLDNEAEFPGCEKRWVLNLIANATTRAVVLDMLLEHGYRWDQILVRRIDKKKLQGLSPSNWTKYDLHVITSNIGRNAALKDGFAAGARWVLPFDGNQFITSESFRAIRASADWAEKRDQQYMKMPIFRLRRPQEPHFLNASTKLAAVLAIAPVKGESQLMFRNDSVRRFNEELQFGIRDKLELLWGVCGKTRVKQNCRCSAIYHELLEDMPGYEDDIKNYASIMKRCGYGVRLWPFPCNKPYVESTVAHTELRPLVRMEGRQRVMLYVMGKLRTFEDMCGRKRFTIHRKQIEFFHNRVLFCQPWGDLDCKRLQRSWKRNPQSQLKMQGLQGNWSQVLRILATDDDDVFNLHLKHPPENPIKLVHPPAKSKGSDFFTRHKQRTVIDQIGHLQRQSKTTNEFLRGNRKDRLLVKPKKQKTKGDKNYDDDHGTSILSDTEDFK